MSQIRLFLFSTYCGFVLDLVLKGGLRWLYLEQSHIFCIVHSSFSLTDRVEDCEETERRVRYSSIKTSIRTSGYYPKHLNAC